MRNLLIAIGLVSLPVSVVAQVGDPALPEIVVTAERRADAAERVPVALSVIDGETLALRGVSGVNQLQNQTPGLEAIPAFGGGQPQFRLRGVGFDDYASNNASPVGVYVDEVAKPFPIQTQGLLFDLARVEILRGPQGTLYGRNTTGGAINLITARPTDRFAGGLDADYGSFGLFRGEGFVSGPLGGGLTARLSAATEQGGGFQRNRTDGRRLGDADRWGARGQLAYDGGGVRLLGEAHWARDTSDGLGLYLFRPLAGVQGADISRRATGWGGSAPFARLTGIGAADKPFRDNRLGGGSGRIEVDLGGATLTSLTAYDHFRRREYNDWDATAAALAGTLFDSRARTVSQELRLASTGAGLRWIVGGYFADERLRDAFTSDFQQSLGFLASTSYRQRAQTLAGFGQADIPLGDRLTLTGGLRLEHERRRLDDFTTTTVPVIGIGVTGGASRLNFTQASGKLAAEYRPGARTLLYASASRGVKSGGFTAYNTLTPDQLAPFKPEILYAYEVGAKGRLADGRLRLSSAAFYYDYRRQQVQSAIYDRVYGAVGKIVNAPRSHIYGIEAEATWAPVAGLTLTQAITWRTGKYDRFTDLDIAASTAAGAARTIDRAGQDQGFPRWNWQGSASYRLPLGGYGLIAEGDYSYRDTLRPVLLGSAYDVRDYWLVNATLTFAPAGERWSIGLYGRNILGTGYDLTRNFFLGGIDIAAPGRPASYGVRGKVRF